MPGPQYIRRHAPATPIAPEPAVWPRWSVLLGWVLLILAVAALVLVFASAGRGEFAPHRVTPTGTWVTPSTYRVGA